MLLLFNKPHRVLSHFTTGDEKQTLKDYVAVPDVYPAGRLDYDSEGLLLLTDDGGLQARIAHPRHGLSKTYFAQVEGTPDTEQVTKLEHGVSLKDGPARAVSAAAVAEPAWVWDRIPPIRYRKSVPTAWLEITLKEGRNRQVRRMTAAVGLPTLRLIRWSVGPWNLEGLPPGATREVPQDELRRALGKRVFSRRP